MKKMLTAVLLFVLAVSVSGILFAGDDTAKEDCEKAKAEAEACKKECEKAREKAEACKGDCEKEKEKAEACKKECEEAKEKAEACCGDKKEASLKIIKMEAFPYAAVEMTGSYELHGEAFGTLYNQAGMQGLDMSAKPMGIYYNDPSDTPMDELKWDIGFKVAEGTEIKDPLKLKTSPAQKAAVDVYEGPMDEKMNAKFEEMYTEIARQGYQPSGAMMIWYVSMPMPGADGSADGKLKIVVPVTKVEAK